VRCCRRRARSPRRGMLVRCDRQEIQCQGCGYQPPGVDRARGRHAAARSHTAVTWPRGDRGRIQAARRRTELRRSRNNSPRAASLRCALSLLRRRPQQTPATLTAPPFHRCAVGCGSGARAVVVAGLRPTLSAIVTTRQVDDTYVALARLLDTVSIP